MPSMAELVEAEAARAETEEPDEEEEALEAEHEREAPDDDDDDEPLEGHRVEPEPQPPADEPAAQLEPIGPDEIQKAERAVTAQRKKLAGILGEGYVAHDCPLCAALGFLPDVPPPGTRLEVTADESGNVGLAMLPPETEPDYVEARDKAACDWCDALGFVLTGSRNPNARLMPCSKCSGNGWVMVPVSVEAPAATASTLLPVDVGPAAPPASLGVDTWGRQPGHPHWGVPPSSIGV